MKGLLAAIQHTTCHNIDHGVIKVFVFNDTLNTVWAERF